MTTNNAINLTDFKLSNLNGNLEEAKGGTGVTSNTAYAVLCGGTTLNDNIQSIVSVGNANEVLTSNGSGNLPTFQSSSSTAWEFISTATASNSTSITFINLSSTYFMYRIVADNIAPITNDTQMLMRTSTNNGGAYDAGASDYAYVFVEVTMDGAEVLIPIGDNLNSSIVIGTNEGTSANERHNLDLYIINPSNASTFTFIIGRAVQTNSGATQGRLYDISGIRLSAADVDAIQFLMAAGNINTGTFKLYGLKAS